MSKHGRPSWSPGDPVPQPGPVTPVATKDVGELTKVIEQARGESAEVREKAETEWRAQERGYCFRQAAIAIFAGHRADERPSGTPEDADKALLDAAYFADMLTRPDLAEYVQGLHDRLGVELEKKQRMRGAR